MFLFLFWCASGYAASVSVSGTIARELIDLGKRIHIYDDSFGRDYIEARSVHCTKTISEKKSEIRCQMIGNGKVPQIVQISSSDSNDPGAASKLRRILMEGSGRDRKINPTTKFLNIDSIVCSGERLERELDSLDSEPKATCMLDFDSARLFL